MKHFLSIITMGIICVGCAAPAPEASSNRATLPQYYSNNHHPQYNYRHYQEHPATNQPIQYVPIVENDYPPVDDEFYRFR